MVEEEDQTDEPVGYASPACSMHQIDPSYMGLPAVNPLSPEMKARRAAERRRAAYPDLAWEEEAPRPDRARTAALGKPPQV